MKASCAVLGMIWVALQPFPLFSGETPAPAARSSIPYVATRNDAVRDMLWLADVGRDDVVYDLGSGDGRIAIAAVRDFGARRAVGIEIDRQRVRESRQNAEQAAVADRVEFRQQDLFTSDLSEASVVTLFLGHEPNITLRPKLLSTLKPGTRIVSHQFGMGEWREDKALTTRMVYFGMWGEMFNPFADNPCVPDYSGNEMHFGTSDRIMMWLVPARAAGAWRGAVETVEGPGDCRLSLHQRPSEVNGTFELRASENQSQRLSLDCELWGTHFRFEGGAGSPPDRLRVRFDGQVRGDQLQGTLELSDRGHVRESTWRAEPVKADFCGTWEWPCPSGPRSVKLRIERRDGRLAATYLDREQSLPVDDFYDWGGGFYFTLLIGRQREGVVITEDTGWLIGEGVSEDGRIAGTISFYPYPGAPGSSPDAKAPTVRQPWTPLLVAP